MNKLQHPNLSPDLTEKARNLRLTTRFSGPGTRKKNPAKFDAYKRSKQNQGNAA